MKRQTLDIDEEALICWNGSRVIDQNVYIACVLRTPYQSKCEFKYHWPKRLRFGMWKGKEKEGQIQWRGIDLLQKPKFVNFN
jgi:hypothetical protein